MKIAETERLILREMTQADLPALCRTLRDPLAMYAYEHAFSEEEARAWLDRQLERYVRDGFGLWAVEEKATGRFVGQCGLSWQKCPDGEVLEIGYLLQRSDWHRGFAAEAAAACRAYAFEKLGAGEVFSIIRDTNIASQNVARRLGMEVRGSFVKHYWGVDMPHLIFSVRRKASR